MKKGAVRFVKREMPACPNISASSRHYFVTLNSFQGPFRLAWSGLAAQWMLERRSPEVKQVQHDESVWRRARNLPHDQAILTRNPQFRAQLLRFG